jgi:hypothetical protein
MTPGIKAAGLVAAVTLALGLYTAAAAGAGDRVELQVRRTVSCTTSLRALQISAFPHDPQTGSANVSITTGNPSSAIGLLGMSTLEAKYGLSKTCHSVSTQVALSHRGLTTVGAVHAPAEGWPMAYCPAPARILLRFVVAFDTSGKPLSATVAIRTQPKPGSGKKSRALGFVQWSPARSVMYHAAACNSQEV